MFFLRLEYLRKQKGFNKKQAAQFLNLPYTTYVNYENGSREPNLSALVFFSEKFGVSVDSLLGLSEKQNKPCLFDFKEQQLLSTYRALSEHGKSAVFKMIYDFVDYESRSAKAPSISQKEESYIPLYYFPASAGTGQFLDGDSYDLVSRNPSVPEKADFGLRVAGDSMMPLYHDSDTVWIQKSDIVENGRIGIFVVNGEAYIKKLRQGSDGVFLVSLNPKYPPIEITSYDHFSCMGRVLS